MTDDTTFLRKLYRGNNIDPIDNNIYVIRKSGNGLIGGAVFA